MHLSRVQVGGRLPKVLAQLVLAFKLSQCALSRRAMLSPMIEVFLVALDAFLPVWHHAGEDLLDHLGLSHDLIFRRSVALAVGASSRPPHAFDEVPELLHRPLIVHPISVGQAVTPGGLGESYSSLIFLVGAAPLLSDRRV
jgi:hypothetical protein